VRREIQAVQEIMQTLQEHLRSALLANSTRDAVGHASAAQQASVDIAARLENQTSGHDESGNRLLEAAQLALNHAIENGERVALASNIDEMRARVIDLKTQVDYADAYLRAWSGD
jgi:hypothetical protein